MTESRLVDVFVRLPLLRHQVKVLYSILDECNLTFRRSGPTPTDVRVIRELLDAAVADADRP